MTNRDSMEQWFNTIGFQCGDFELPILDRLYPALEKGELDEIEHWCNYLYCRKTSELRAEEKQRGHALNTLMTRLDIDISLVDSVNSHPEPIVGHVYRSSVIGILI